MKAFLSPLSLLFLSALILASACQSSKAPEDCGSCCQQSRPSAAAPLDPSVDVVETAKTFALASATAAEFPGLHNVFHLSDNIISGGEPHGREALQAIADMGVKVILSVDGKVPDGEGAAELGMRYVHIPIQYSGIGELEMKEIAKTFRELEGPFYVHCFHGKHRGPAAAEVGRLVLDNVSRGQALAEMYQWCGTSVDYQGLFETIGLDQVPDAETTQALAFDFPAAHPFDGFRATMVPMARGWDEIKAARKRDWAGDPAHPDIVPAQEALQLSQIFARCQEQTDLPADTEQVRGWLRDGEKGTGDLARILLAQKELQAQGEDWKAQAEDAYKLAAQSCKQCHGEYRN